MLLCGFFKKRTIAVLILTVFIVFHSSILIYWIETQVRSQHINRKRHTDSNPWMTRLQINLIARYLILTVLKILRKK
jgi:hypothetical protein